MLIAFTVRNRSAHKLHDLQFCVQHSTRLHSPDADTTWKTIPLVRTVLSPRTCTCCLSANNSHFCCRLPAVKRLLQVKSKNYCLAFLFVFYCCHFPPIVLPDCQPDSLYSLFGFCSYFIVM